jgi:phage shock protein C
MIFGVCKGIAAYAELNVFWLRLAMVAALLMTGVFPTLILYILAAIFMKPEPVLDKMNEDDHEFYHSYADNRHMALSRLKRRLDSLQRRAKRMENIVTDREYDWERRFRSSN